MNGSGAIIYEATYRRSERVMPGLFLILAIFLAGIYVCIRYVKGPIVETAIFSLLIVVLVLLGGLVANAFRIHRWAVVPGGLHIDERPCIPLTGRPRHAVIPMQTLSRCGGSKAGSTI